MNKYFVFGVTATTAVVLDQLTKSYIRSTMPLYTSIEVIDSFFHLTHVSNPGGAFSLFAGADASWRPYFFLVAPVFAIGVLLFMVRQVNASQRLLTFALGGILGGAIGNLIDRARLGGVTDFLDFHFRGYHWPAFNVADSCISVGIVVLMAFSLFGNEPQRE